jgi:hypothetical protein
VSALAATPSFRAGTKVGPLAPAFGPCPSRSIYLRVSHDEHIGAFVRSVPVPRQANDPDITVVSLDLHRDGFVVQCEIGGSRGLTPTGPVSLDLRDSLYTRYERVGHGEDFIAYKPAIPADADWLKVYTSPETHIDLGESN